VRYAYLQYQPRLPDNQWLDLCRSTCGANIAGSYLTPSGICGASMERRRIERSGISLLCFFLPFLPDTRLLVPSASPSTRVRQWQRNKPHIMRSASHSNCLVTIAPLYSNFEVLAVLIYSCESCIWLRQYSSIIRQPGRCEKGFCKIAVVADSSSTSEHSDDV
jgi:hypothetical protein